jgi:hypothetical protein
MQKENLEGGEGFQEIVESEDSFIEGGEEGSSRKQVQW